MHNIAIYAGTFDPITLGHVDVIERASRIVNRLIIGIALNKNKKPLFDLVERVNLTTLVLNKFKGVEVMGFDSLLIDFAKSHQANIIVRGLRHVTDFDYEFQLANMNRNLNPTIETLFLMPAEKYMSISSTLVREIASYQGDVSGFVPSEVVKALQNKIKA